MTFKVLVNKCHILPQSALEPNRAAALLKKITGIKRKKGYYGVSGPQG